MVLDANRRRIALGIGPARTTGDRIETTADGGTRVTVVILPYGGREVKGVMRPGAEMRYEWAASGGEVEFDFHGESSDKSHEESYEKGTRAAASGTLKATFAGLHGWYWENRSQAPVTVTVTAKGAIAKFAPQDEPPAVLTASPAAGAGDAPYLVDMPMRPFMERVMQRAADGLWEHPGYITDENGERSLFPKTDEEWVEAENSSLLLANAANLLLIPGRRIAEPAWDKAALDVRRVALKAAAARKNEAQYMDAAGELDGACEGCHLKYDPTMKAYPK